MMSDLQAPPNYPVIVVHIEDGNGLTACTGQPMPGPAGDVYRNVPRYFCQACAKVMWRVDKEGATNDG
jgi:hypothetical protein